MPADVVNAGGQLIAGVDLLNALGSFWSQQFDDVSTLRTFLDGDALQQAQVYLDLLEAKACVSRQTTPVFHRYRWYALKLRKSQMDTGLASMLRYDSTAEYDGAYLYGVAYTFKFHTVTPDQLKRIVGLFDHVRSPSLAWTLGAEFAIDSEGLKLRYNPFDDSRLEVTNVVDSVGNVLDQEVTLWAYEATEDRNFLYDHYGYVLRRALDSSVASRELINAFWDALVGGFSSFGIEQVLSAVADVPTAKTDGEVVELVLDQGDKIVIATDRNAYVYQANAQPAVEVGDVVYAGQCLTDTVRVFDLADAAQARAALTSAVTDVQRFDPAQLPALSAVAPPNYPLLTTLYLGANILGPDYVGTLGFPNALVTVDISRVDAAGRIKARIPGLHGGAQDIERFWNNAHTAGVAAGSTWWDAMGRPTQINAAGFMIEQLLRNHALLVYLQTSEFGPHAAGIPALDVLRRLLPPDKLVLFVIDSEIEEVCDVDEADTPSSYLGMQTSETVTVEEGLVWNPISYAVNLCP